MTTTPLLSRIYHWASTGAVFLLFAFLTLSHCEGQQAPAKSTPREISDAVGESPDAGQEPNASNPSKMSDAQLEKAIKDHAAKQSQGTQPWDAPLVKFLTVSVLAFGLIVIGIMAVLVLNKSQTGDVLRLFTVPMVIVAAVFLVVTGFSNSQITPVIGLLGTLAGYVLGVQSQKAKTDTSTTHRADKGGTASS